MIETGNEIVTGCLIELSQQIGTAQVNESNMLIVTDYLNEKIHREGINDKVTFYRA